MKLGLIIAGILLGGLLLVAGIGAIWGIGTYNKAVGLRAQATARQKANESTYDNMWKKISQVVQVNDSHKNALKEIFTSYAEARTGSGDNGKLMTWVKEAIPNATQLGQGYSQVINIITGSRDEWTRDQVALVDFAREYNLMLDRFPSNLLLGMFGFQKFEVKLVTSARTDNAFKTGQDNDVSLPIK